VNITFQDRVPTYPNRYKITREDGSSEYVTLKRADNPTVEGTPLNADTLNAAFNITPEGIGALTMDLLWLNADEYSDFPSQTINLDLSNYNFVVIWVGGQVAWCKVGDIANLVDIESMQDSEPMYASYRAAAVTSTYIMFTQGYKKEFPNGTSQAGVNDRLKPYAIYGVRGVN
jgi:hypothetical protein